MRINSRNCRPGSVLPLVAGSIVGLVFAVALAVDLGMVAMMRNQCQNTADAAAMTALRQLNGDSATSFNHLTASTQAQAIAQQQRILKATVDPATQLTLRLGRFSYNDATGVKSFEQNVVGEVHPNNTLGSVTEPFTLSEAVVTASRPAAFSRLFGVTEYTMSATARAIHRPRDIALVMDFSGSMNNESDLWNNEGYLGNANGSPNNADPLVPRFGPYSLSSNTNFTFPGNSSFNTELVVQTNTDSRVRLCNVTTAAAGTASMTGDYFADPLSSTVSPYGSVPAFPTGATGARWTLSAGPDAGSFMHNPEGDIPLRKNGRLAVSDALLPYARTVRDILGDNPARNNDWETKGYDWFYGYNTIANARILATIPDPNNLRPRTSDTEKVFRGFTRGPGHWGVSFMIWPPDPRAPVGKPGDTDYTPGDWRRRYFINGEEGGAGTLSATDFSKGVRDNTRLWRVDNGNNDGIMEFPDATGTRYRINYRAILNWIKSTNTFPDRLRCGRIVYYQSIPTDFPAGAYNPGTRNRDIAWDTSHGAAHAQDQRFWKEYIDWTLGCWRDPQGNNAQAPANPSCSMGPDFVWLQPKSGGGMEDIKAAVQITAAPTGSDTRYMDYEDRPRFPRHRGWFGAMTMIQFISDTGLLPGPAHDNSMYAMKLGVQGAFNDIKINYPNSQASLAYFNRPRFNGEGADVGQFSVPQVALTNDYDKLIKALWYPPSSTNTSEIHPWDSIAEFIPSAFGDYTGNTTSAYGLILAHNQLTSAAAARTAGAGGTAIGGFGRKGADRLVIFETDGMANVPIETNNAGLFVKTGSSPKESYYNTSFTISGGGTVSTLLKTRGGGNTEAQDDALAVVNRMTALETDETNGPGFARSNNPVTVHCLAFGAVMEGTASGGEKDKVIAFLQAISAKGNTTFPGTATDADNGYKWCIGNMEERKTRLKTAILNCMRSGVRIALVQ